MSGEKTSQGSVSLGPIAYTTSRNEVATRSITALHARLNMIDRQVIDGEDGPAVDAPEFVALENLIARQRTVPELVVAVCNPRI